jgi:uncharacterized protein
MVFPRAISIRAETSRLGAGQKVGRAPSAINSPGVSCWACESRLFPFGRPNSITDSQDNFAVRFDTAEHFEAWMNSPERAELLSESKVFIEQEQLLRLATSFPGWVPINPLTGKGPPNWKTALLVILGVYPMVMLEIRFLSPFLTSLGFRAALTTFIVNCLTAAATTFILMPRFIRLFGWWLFDDPKKPAWVEPAGLLTVVGLYAIEIASVWHLLPW